MRKTGAKAQVKSGGRRANSKEMAKKAVGLLTSSHLLPHEARAGAIRALEVIVKGIQISQREARDMRTEVIFTPQGRIVVGGLGSFTITNNQKGDPSKNNEAALAAAVKRGTVTVATIMAGPEMMTGERFAELAGMTRMAVHKKLKKHQILGLEGAKRGVRYPDWQLGDDGRPVPGLSALLSKFAGKTWAAYRFLLQHHAGLGKMTAIDALKAGKTEAVLEAADSALSGDFS